MSTTIDEVVEGCQNWYTVTNVMKQMTDVRFKRTFTITMPDAGGAYVS